MHSTAPKITCFSIGCEKAPAVIAKWPGTVKLFCEDDAARALQIAGACGLPVHLEPITLGGIVHAINVRNNSEARPRTWSPED